jgi:GT2 family glycosyltransferase
VRSWASGEEVYDLDPNTPFHMELVAKPIALAELTESEIGATPAGNIPKLSLIRAQANGGFASGVNLGMAYLAKDPEVTDFWVLNPDSVVPPGTTEAFAAAAKDQRGYGLMGGSIRYFDTPEVIQIDGGTINWKTGITGNLNQGLKVSEAPVPRVEDIDYISGASMVVSREFYEFAGAMQEDYFLYYEEVDWALKRGAMPLAYCEGGAIYHKAGTSIGSGTLTRSASPFSLYFKHRARLLFLRNNNRGNALYSYGYTIAKAGQLVLHRDFGGAMAIIRGSFGMAPPSDVIERLSPEAQRIVLGTS